MELLSFWWLLPLAVLLDLAVGDPRWIPHPVRLFGWAAARLEPVFRRLPCPLTVSGALYAAVLIAGAYVGTLWVVRAALAVHPVLGGAVQAALVASCIAARCLSDEVGGVGTALSAGDVPLARERVAMLVSRDARVLDAGGVCRAAVETVSENFVDGVLAPVFFAAVLGAPGAMAHKMASTLDSMVGYRNARYEQFGKAAARTDDVLAFVPARLSVPVTALAASWLFRTGRRAWDTAWREGHRHKSPNAGYPEAAFAGALGVRINGPSVYDGVRVEKPWTGEGNPLPEPRDIGRARALMLLSTLLGAAACTVPLAAFAL